MESLMLPGIVMYKILFNTLFVSFWEELYLVVLTLIFTDEFCFLQHPDKEVRKVRPVFVLKIVSVALISGLLSNFMRYTGADHYISLGISFIVMYALLLVFFGLWSDIKDFAMCFIFLAVGITSILSIEYAYIPLITSSIDMKMLEVNNNLLFNALMSLPERLINIVTILYLLSKKATYLKANIIKPLMESTWLMILAALLVLGDLVFMAITLYNACYYKVFVGLPFGWQILTMASNLSFPIFNIAAFFMAVYIKENRACVKKSELKDVVSRKIDTIKEYTKNADYDKIDIILEEIKDKMNNL